MNEYVIECFNTGAHEFEYLRISAISAKEAIEHFKNSIWEAAKSFWKKEIYLLEC